MKISIFGDNPNAITGKNDFSYKKIKFYFKMFTHARGHDRSEKAARGI
jgi:hypothetical protein